MPPLTSQEIWMNEMKGFGTGVASLVSVHGSSSAHLLAAAVANASAATSSSTAGA